MTLRISIALLLTAICALPFLDSEPAWACCPCPPIFGKPVVNADQTVIIIWDAATQTQHFIRQASFKSEADDFGFLIPSPSQPELDESGNDAFPYLQKLTEPELKRIAHGSGIGCGCSAGPGANLEGPAGSPPPVVTVLEKKLVAGFHAAVLETKSTTALVQWLKDNNYAFSPEVEAWAKPYVEAGWKITALKVAKAGDAKDKKDVAASAMRISFKTDRPLFPYREPDYKNSAETLGAKNRLLRIYFLAEARYSGDLNRWDPWTALSNTLQIWKGRVAWSGKITHADRKKVLQLLKLPELTPPQQWWLTEFEDNWPYKVAPEEDLYFSKDRDHLHEEVRRAPNYHSSISPWPTDAMGYALAAVVIMPSLVTRLRRRRSQTTS